MLHYGGETLWRESDCEDSVSLTCNATRGFVSPIVIVVVSRSGTRCPRNPLSSCTHTERIAGPAACRPECTETYISLQARLTSGTSESRSKFTTPKARASNSVTKAAFCEVRTNSFRNSTSPNLSRCLRETRMMITTAAGSSTRRALLLLRWPCPARRGCHAPSLTCERARDGKREITCGAT